MLLDVDVDSEGGEEFVIGLGLFGEVEDIFVAAASAGLVAEAEGVAGFALFCEDFFELVGSAFGERDGGEVGFFFEDFVQLDDEIVDLCVAKAVREHASLESLPSSCATSDTLKTATGHL